MLFLFLFQSKANRNKQTNEMFFKKTKTKTKTVFKKVLKNLLKKGGTERGRVERVFTIEKQRFN